MYHNSYAERGNQRSNQTKTKDSQSPLDTVSSLLWYKYSQETMFFATSWDGYVRCYMVKNSNYSGSCELQLVWKMFLNHPVLCCDIHPDNILLVGIATGDIVAINLSDSQIMRVGGHDAPICGLFWLQQNNLLISLGFDNLVRFWQLGKGDQTHVGQIKLGLKTHTTTYDPPYLLIGSSQGTISIVNLKNLQNAKFPKESHNYLKTTIQLFSKFNCSSISSIGKMLALGTMDGRTVLTKFKESYNQFSIEPIVSKTQKKPEGRGLYGQINCVDIGYRNCEGFYLIGGTEDLAAYNVKRKSKVCQFSLNKSPATSVRMHPNFDIVIYATGTDWTRGISQLDNIKRPRIYLRKMAQSQIKQLTSNK